MATATIARAGGKRTSPTSPSATALNSHKHNRPSWRCGAVEAEERRRGGGGAPGPTPAAAAAQPAAAPQGGTNGALKGSMPMIFTEKEAQSNSFLMAYYFRMQVRRVRWPSFSGEDHWHAAFQGTVGSSLGCCCRLGCCLLVWSWCASTTPPPPPLPHRLHHLHEGPVVLVAVEGLVAEGLLDCPLPPALAIVAVASL